jgi:hypothetical protein
MGENEPVQDSTCQERMAAQNAQIQLMFEQIRSDVREVKADVKDLKASTAGYVSWEAFREKCREIEDMKRFVWKVSGGLSVVSFLIGLAVKFLK